MRILITGASGLLGINAALEAARRYGGSSVVGVVNHHGLKTEAFEVMQADLLAPGALAGLIRQVQPDWVINCAALALVDACESQPDLAYRLNTALPAELAALVARGGARLVHLSTDAVFDGSRGGYSESDVPNPLSTYARSKLDGERAVAEANPQALIARTNLYGWSLVGTRSLAEWFFYNLQARKGMMGFTDVFFCPLLANQLAGLLFDMLERGLSGLYHVVSPECTSKYDFGTALARRFGLEAGLIRPASVAEAGLTAARSPNLTLSPAKLEADLGRELPDQAAGMEAFFDLYQQGYPQMLKAMALANR